LSILVIILLNTPPVTGPANSTLGEDRKDTLQQQVRQAVTPTTPESPNLPPAVVSNELVNKTGQREINAPPAMGSANSIKGEARQGVPQQSMRTSIIAPPAEEIPNRPPDDPKNGLVSNTGQRHASTGLTPLTSPIPKATPIPEGIAISTEMFSWIEGVTQEKKNDCLSTAKRQPFLRNPGTTYVRLPSEGLQCFFDTTDQLYDIRLEAPFHGSVSGIRLGDSEDRLQKLGSPFKRDSVPRNTLHKVREDLFYDLGDALLLHVELDNNNIIRTMWVVHKGAHLPPPTPRQQPPLPVTAR
jgi:hypothetical protein